MHYCVVTAAGQLQLVKSPPSEKGDRTAAKGLCIALLRPGMDRALTNVPSVTRQLGHVQPTIVQLKLMLDILTA